MRRHVPRADVRGLALLRGPAPVGQPHDRRHGHRRGRSAWPASRSPTASGCRSPGTSAALHRARSARCTRSRSTSGTSTSSSTSLIVRPAAWVGRFCDAAGRARRHQRRAHRRHDRRRARGRAAVRGVQTGFLRYYAALLRARHRRGHLLLPRRVTLHLSIMLWLPAAFALLGAFLPGSCPAAWRSSGRSLALAYAVVYVVDFDTGARRPAVRHRRARGSRRWASTTSSASTG